MAALAAFGIYEASLQAPGATASSSPERRDIGRGRGQFGLDTFVSGPTLFLAGEGGRERVTITPEGRESTGGGLTANIHIYGSGDPEAAARAVKRELEILVDRERIRRS